MSGRKKVACACGCCGEGYWNNLQCIEIEQALDAKGQQTTLKRLYVLPECEEAYEAELGMMQLLRITIQRWAPKVWWKRLAVARRVLRLQHGIFERNKGFDFARKHAIRSMILFVAPAFLGNFLHRRFAKQMNEANAAITPTAAVTEAEA